MKFLKTTLTLVGLFLLLISAFYQDTKAGIKVEFEKIWETKFEGIFYIAEPLGISEYFYGYDYNMETDKNQLLKVSEKTGKIEELIGPEILPSVELCTFASYRMPDTNFIISGCGSGYWFIDLRNGNFVKHNLPDYYKYVMYSRKYNSIICVQQNNPPYGSNQLYKYDLDSNTITRLTRQDGSFLFLMDNSTLHYSYRFSPQGNYLCHLGGSTDEYYKTYFRSAVEIVSLSDFKLHNIIGEHKIPWNDGNYIDTISYSDAVFSDDETKLALIPSSTMDYIHRPADYKFYIDIFKIKENYKKIRVYLPYSIVNGRSSFFDSTGKYLIVLSQKCCIINTETGNIEYFFTPSSIGGNFISKVYNSNFFYVNLVDYSRKNSVKITEDSSNIHNNNDNYNIIYNNNLLNIDTQNNNLINSIDIYDVNGRQIFQKENIQSPINLPISLSTGIYFVNIYFDNNSFYSQKIIVQ